ncbi:MAG: hypothetical protein DLM68_17865 [Hyphomicrobiales bacterium]|nr:MAG: hypothetical protein DLM68_17865 [Hyphomicrobiales bacterium]
MGAVTELINLALDGPSEIDHNINGHAPPNQGVTLTLAHVRGAANMSGARQNPASLRRGHRVLLAASATGSIARSGQQCPRAAEVEKIGEDKTRKARGLASRPAALRPCSAPENRRSAEIFPIVWAMEGS